MRKYQRIWERIKADFAAQVLVQNADPERIIAGVIKEKKKDIGFKYLQEENKKKYRLRIEKTSKKLITFRLVESKTISLHQL